MRLKSSNESKEYNEPMIQPKTPDLEVQVNDLHSKDEPRSSTRAGCAVEDSSHQYC
jgi:hypothetical protein